MRRQGLSAARKKHKRKHKKKDKKPEPNAFGCLEIGDACKSAAQCCSGICQGKKPKKGKRDKRKCVGHNEGGCIPERSNCLDVPPVLAACNPEVATAACFGTTGNAGFCGNVAFFDPAVNCQRCTKDADCAAAGFPPGSACVVIFPGGGRCGDVCAATGNLACLTPGI